MRKLATIRLIEEVLPIEGADAIEKVRIGGWWVVARKNEFKPGDKCVYFEIDSLLPPLPQYAFLEKAGKKKTLFEGRDYEGYRIKTIKLRGQISQGLALPVASFPGIPDELGADVSEKIGVVKYEATVPVFNDNFILDQSYDQLLKIADMKSVYNPNVNAEGLVFRLYDSRIKVTFKVISNQYLLKQE